MFIAAVLYGTTVWCRMGLLSLVVVVSMFGDVVQLVGSEQGTVSWLVVLAPLRGAGGGPPALGARLCPAA